MISVLIPAAGTGLRLAAGEVKALVPVAGRPMLIWSVEALAAVRGVGEILVAAPGEAVDRFQSLREETGRPLWRDVIAGGDTRADSVRLLLDRARGERIIVHDAARPCVTTPWVSALLAQMDGAVAGVPALPVRDTLKRGRDGVVIETVSREGLFSIQTPQIFDADLLRRAHARREQTPAAGPEVTDDATLVEAIGAEVRLLSGEPSNLKVTYPDDVALAAKLLEARW